MSPVDVDLVRTVYEGWSRGDFTVGKDLVSEDFEWRQFDQAIEPGPRRGEAIGESLRNLFEVYEDIRVEPLEFIRVGGKVIVVQRTRGTARQSGLELDQTSASLWTVREGRLIRHELYLSRLEAIEAAASGSGQLPPRGKRAGGQPADSLADRPRQS